MQAAVIDQFKAAIARGAPLAIQGGATKRFYGLPSSGTPLDVSGHRGVINYEPTELVLHARCGTRLAEIEALLLEHHQMLPFEPPHFGEAATLGGCIAAGLSGPARVSAGALRDFVLGATLLDSRGQILTFGGQVMKNVAGYDVSRLLAGSLGTLGLILDVSLKVLPRPQASQTQRLLVDASAALELFDTWRAKPLPLSASMWHEGVLLVRLAGAPAAVKAGTSIIGGESVSDADTVWSSIREQQHAFFAGDAPLWRVALPAGTPLLMGADRGLMEWHGTQRWLRGVIDAKALRAEASRHDGHATLFRAAAEIRLRDGVFTPPAAAVMQIQRQLKQRFDPAGVFNPQRMYREF